MNLFYEEGSDASVRFITDVTNTQFYSDPPNTAMPECNEVNMEWAFYDYDRATSSFVPLSPDTFPSLIAASDPANPPKDHDLPLTVTTAGVWNNKFAVKGVKWNGSTGLYKAIALNIAPSTCVAGRVVSETTPGTYYATFKKGATGWGVSDFYFDPSIDAEFTVTPADTT